MTASTTASRNAVLHWATFVLVLVFKLALVSQSEVVSSRFDGWSYVNLASYAEPWEAIGPAPGYPYWLWLCALIGAPQRIAIEILYVACCAVFARGIGSSLAGFKGFAIVLTVTAFSPVTFFLFDQTLSDGFYLCLALMACGLLARVIINASPARRWPGSTVIALGLLLGCMDLTRRETPVTIIVCVALAAVLLTRFRYLTDRGWRQSIRKSLAIVGTIAFTAWLVTFVVLLEHERTEGVWSYSLAEIPSHLALLKRLASIETGEPPQRFIPITRHARQLAYEASPTLKKFETAIEDPSNPFQAASLENLGKPGEVGAGWIWHVFNSSAGTIGIRSARGLDSSYQQINGELDAAFASGRLRKHFVIHPLIGVPATWVPYFFDSLLGVSSRIWQAETPQVDAGFDVDLFNRVCFRRASSVPTPSTLLSGWALQLPGRAVTVFASESSGGDGQLTPTIRTARSDVRDGYAKEGLTVPELVGFTSRLVVGNSAELHLQIRTEEGEVLESGPLVPGQVQTVVSAQGHNVLVGLDKVPGAITPRAAGWSMQTMAEAVEAYRAIPTWLALAMFAPIVAYLLVCAATREWRIALPKIAVILLIMLWIGARVLLYALLDSAAWAAEPRYVESVSVMLVGVAGACLMGTFAELIRRRRK